MNRKSHLNVLNTFIGNLLLIVFTFGLSLILYYLYMPLAGVIFLSFLMMIGRMATMDHVPIGMHSQYIFRGALQEGDPAASAGLPSWIVRFASEGDSTLINISLIGTFMCNLILIAYSLYATTPLLAKQAWELGTVQLLLLPHLLGLVTLGLVSLRDQICRRMYAHACAMAKTS